MNSSISSSDAARWRRFVATVLVAATGLALALTGALVLLDPYDRGAFGQPHRGIADAAPRTADASRARDPAFDSAILGNSHIQLVDPAALSRDTGLAFVSLTVPGTGPREQLAILDAFLRHHEGTAGALVFGIDQAWCTQDEALPLTDPFPFWLYDPSRLTYLRGLLRYAALEQAVRRIGFAFGLIRPARRDGYWNYAQGRSPNFGPAAPAPAPDGPPAAQRWRFPALDILAEKLRHLPDAVAVVLVRPPVHASELPAPASARAAAEAACRSAQEALPPRHGATSLIDLRRDGPQARDPALWFDATHYGEPVARAVEAAVSAAIRDLRRPEPGPRATAAP